MSFVSAIEGVTPPLVTPFAADGSIDEAAYRSVIDHAINGGVRGLFPCGTTGEFASLSAAERTRAIEIAVDAADDRPVLAGAAGTHVGDVVAAIESATDLGATAAVVTPPYFHTANDPDGNLGFFRAIAEQSPLPLLLYNIPSCTGAPIDPETVATLAAEESYVGIKDSSGDFGYFLQLLRKTPESFAVLQGFDNLLIPSLRAGADGGIHALSNVIPSIFAEAYEAAETDRGLELQFDAISPLFEACLETGFAPGTKAALAHRGVISDTAVRPPLVEPNDDTANSIADALDAAIATIE